MLKLSESVLLPALEAEITANQIIRTLHHGKTVLALASLYQAEISVAKCLKSLLFGDSFPWGKVNAKTAIPWVEQKTKLQLADSQKAAIIQALQSKVMIITGGPGVGKTTIVNSLIKIFQIKKLKIELCEPVNKIV